MNFINITMLILSCISISLTQSISGSAEPKIPGLNDISTGKQQGVEDESGPKATAKKSFAETMDFVHPGLASLAALSLFN